MGPLALTRSWVGPKASADEKSVALTLARQLVQRPLLQHCRLAAHLQVRSCSLHRLKQANGGWVRHAALPHPLAHSTTLTTLTGSPPASRIFCRQFSMLCCCNLEQTPALPAWHKSEAETTRSGVNSCGSTLCLVATLVI